MRRRIVAAAATAHFNELWSCSTRCAPRRIRSSAALALLVSQKSVDGLLGHAKLLSNPRRAIAGYDKPWAPPADDAHARPRSSRSAVVSRHGHESARPGRPRRPRQPPTHDNTPAVKAILTSVAYGLLSRQPWQAFICSLGKALTMSRAVFEDVAQAHFPTHPRPGSLFRAATTPVGI